jgi:hypothetical protein
MNNAHIKPRPSVAFTIVMVILSFNDSLRASDWQEPSAESVKAKAMEWLGGKNTDQSIRARADAIWSHADKQSGERDVLSQLADTFALADENADKLTSLCSQIRNKLILPDQKWLSDSDTPPFVAKNMRLFYARWLVSENMFDEARQQLDGIEPSDVVAPAALLFYKSVVYHKLLEKESGLKTLDKLLDEEAKSPRRYAVIAKLMRDDLDGLETDSLDHISRRMNDIRRRLDLGRAGPNVKNVEDGVIDSLDKLINKLEKQQQEQQQSESDGSTLRPSSPAHESTPMGGKGPGDVTKRDVGSKSDWGNLPPKDREEALQQIGRDFPAHYRDVIEQYFKKLASEEGQ